MPDPLPAPGADEAPGTGAAPRLPALRHRGFRALWLGQIVSLVGSQMQLTAINWHVYELLKGRELSVEILGQSRVLQVEALGLGGLGLANVIPIIAFALLGGMVADAGDRRRIMLAAQSGLALAALCLAALTLSGRVDVAWIYLLSAATAAGAAFNNPAQQSLVPRLVPRAHLANAVSLNTLGFQVGTIAGPALAGLIVAVLADSGVAADSTQGLGTVYALNALSYLAVITALLRLRVPEAAEGRPETLSSGVGWRPLLAGLRFVRGERLIWSTMLLDFFATFFSGARTMLPIVAGDMLGLGVRGYGLLSTAQPVGSVLAGSALALKRSLGRQGPILLASVALYGLATALFGLSAVAGLSYLLFALTGAADTVSTVIRATLRQLRTPDHLRGRMVGINMMFFMGGPQLGELEAGLVAALAGVPFAIVSGGLATVGLTALVAWKVPDLRRYDGGAPEAEPERAPAGA